MGISRSAVKPLEEAPPVVFVDKLPAKGSKRPEHKLGPSWWKSVSQILRERPDSWGLLPVDFPLRTDQALSTLQGYLPLRLGDVHVVQRQGKVYAKWAPHRG